MSSAQAEGGPSGEDVQVFCNLLEQMNASMTAARDIVKSVREKQNTGSGLDTREGISLLSLKNHMMLSYLQSLSLITARRAIGHSLMERDPPSAPFSAKDRPLRGAGAGDRVDATVEARVVLEKLKVLEGRMGYQIDKLVRIAQEGSSEKDIVDNPLAFRPNPQALMDQDSEHEHDRPARAANDDGRDGIYRPPRLAPVPYTDTRKPKDKESRTTARRAPLPFALAHLAHLDPSRPHVESTSGLGAAPSHASARARELKRMTEFEEDNFTRLVMKKKEMRRRAVDEADIALGGTGMTSTRRGRVPGAGLDDQFEDILKSVGRSRQGAMGDGYEELRQRGKKDSVLARSRARSRDAPEDLGEDGPRMRKRSRFEKEVKAAKKRALSKAKTGRKT